METQKLLQALGLSSGEGAVYLSLLKGGPLNLAEAAAKAKLHRPAAYRALPALVSKGLATSTLHGKRRYYRAESPKKLLNLFEHLRDSFVKTLPALEHYARRRPGRSIVRHHLGARGIKAVYDDVVDSLGRGQTFMRYSSSGGLRPKGKYVSRDYEKRRDAKQLQRLVVTNKRNSLRKGKNLNRFVKVLPPEFDLFEYDVTELIYGNKIAFVDYNSETATTIENPVLAKFQRKLFEFVYSKLD